MADSRKIQGGIAYYPLQKQHRFNIKAGFGRLLQTGQPDRSQFNIQGQFLFY